MNLLYTRKLFQFFVLIPLIGISSDALSREYMMMGDGGGGSSAPENIPVSGASSVPPSASLPPVPSGQMGYSINTSPPYDGPEWKVPESTTQKTGFEVDTEGVSKKTEATGTILELSSNKTFQTTGKMINAAGNVKNAVGVAAACSGGNASENCGTSIMRVGQDAALVATCSTVGGYAVGAAGAVIAGPPGAVVGVAAGQTAGAVVCSYYSDEINSALAPSGYKGLDQAGGAALKNTVEANAKMYAEQLENGYVITPSSYGFGAIYTEIPNKDAEFEKLNQKNVKSKQEVEKKKQADAEAATQTYLAKQEGPSVSDVLNIFSDVYLKQSNKGGASQSCNKVYNTPDGCHPGHDEKAHAGGCRC